MPLLGHVLRQVLEHVPYRHMPEHVLAMHMLGYVLGLRKIIFTEKKK